MKYTEQTLEALENGYEYNWIIDDSLKQTDVRMFDKLCDRIREDNHEGSCWDLLKTFDQFAHEYCERVKKGTPREIICEQGNWWHFVKARKSYEGREYCYWHYMLIRLGIIKKTDL